MFSNFVSVCSIYTQAALEIMRVWIAHRTGRWLFKRVDSAGCNVVTEFAEPFIDDNLYDHAGMTYAYDLPYIDLRKYEWSSGYPNEVKDILNRAKRHTVAGLSGSDFSMYDFIICLGRSTEERLLKMQAATFEQGERKAHSSKIIRFLYAQNRLTNKAIAADEGKMKEFTNAIETDINAFITTELQQDITPQIDKGFRILQFESSDLRVFAKGEKILTIQKFLSWRNSLGAKLTSRGCPQAVLTNFWCRLWDRKEATSGKATQEVL